jgi:hypothetical protein
MIALPYFVLSAIAVAFVTILRLPARALRSIR